MVEESTPDEATAVLSLVVDATAEDLFPMFTDPGRLAAWFWPPEFAAIYDVNPRPGGKFSFRSTALPDRQNIGVRGIFGEIRPPRLLTYIWAWEGDLAPATQVVIEMRPHEKGTEIVVTHGQNPTKEQRDDHQQGWHDCLSRLADYMAVG